MSFLKKLLDGAVKLSNDLAVRAGEIDEHKKEFKHLSDRELFDAGKRENNHVNKLAISAILRDRGYEFDNESCKWYKK